ncbi:tryparedoxin [Salpingoeca rosetta]|uniref:Tryparedoxin n=1 Tax=Salpingoeca rosetta (strain ATCC 50818 / BSB-021) TaxID=946362 RepID=F2U2K2_SALR5|nr:tryparedoxin [Salpingoeca rosetta]EGD81357.1 tryparedoxin [Salpingoeca rosetta]|eukprot:XP_004996561.1 tryparedoxin [Salpingoeca rosetta]
MAKIAGAVVELTRRCPTVVDAAYNHKQFSEVLEQNEVVGLYFSSYSCPACRKMTPKLVEVYNDLRRRNRSFEMVFVSGDTSQHDFVGYFSSMPWLTLPDFPASPSILFAFFRVWMLPTLILLRSDGTVITRSGCSLLLNHAHEFPWPGYRDANRFLSLNTCIALTALCALAGLLYLLLMML